MGVLALLLAAQVVQAIGTLLLKHGVSSHVGDEPFGAFLRGLGPSAGRLVQDRAWLAGALLLTVGALLGLQSLALADLGVVNSMARLQTLLVVAGGALWLGERLAPRELGGVLAITLGVGLLAPSAGEQTGLAPPRSVLLGMLMGTGALLGGVAAVRRLAPKRLTREIALALALGAFLGLTDVVTRLAVDAARVPGVGFRVYEASAVWALVTTPEFALVVLTLAAQLVLAHAALAAGRVSVVSPVSGLLGSLIPLLFAIAVLGESLHGTRALGIASLLVGSLVVTGGPGPRRNGAAASRERPAALR